MAPDQRAFVRAVRAHLGLSPTELGERLGKRNAYASVNAWETTNAKNYRRLSYTDTMALLELAGWLNMLEDAPDLTAAPDPLEEVARGVRDLLSGQERLLAELSQEPARAKPAPRRAAPKRRSS